MNWPHCRTCNQPWDELCQNYREDCDPVTPTQQPPQPAPRERVAEMLASEESDILRFGFAPHTAGSPVDNRSFRMGRRDAFRQVHTVFSIAEHVTNSTQQPPQPMSATVSHGTTTDAGLTEALQGHDEAQDPDNPERRICIWCATSWPCDVEVVRRRLDAARAELARVTALREAVAHVLVCHAAVVAAATPKRGGPDPMFVDVSTEQARLDDAVDELAALAQASERAAGSGEGE